MSRRHDHRRVKSLRTCVSRLEPQEFVSTEDLPDIFLRHGRGSCKISKLATPQVDGEEKAGEFDVAILSQSSRDSLHKLGRVDNVEYLKG
jgi:hypothetical protein